MKGQILEPTFEKVEIIKKLQAIESLEYLISWLKPELESKLKDKHGEA